MWGGGSPVAASGEGCLRESNAGERPLIRRFAPPSPQGRWQKNAHTFFASTAIRTASPASTVPISQRWTSSQLGRLAEEQRDRAGRQRDHRIDADADRDLDRAEHQRLRQHAAGGGIDELRQQRQIEHRDLRIEQVGDQAHREQFARAVDRQARVTWNGERPPGFTACQASHSR